MGAGIQKKKIMFLNSSVFIFVTCFLIVLFLSLSACDRMSEEERSLVSGKNATRYINNELNFEFMVPDGWCLIDRNNYPDYFYKISQRGSSEQGYQHICILIEKKNLNLFDGFNQQVFPIMTILLNENAIPLGSEGKPENIVNKLYKNAREGYMLAEESQQYQIRFKSKIIKTHSGESILKTVSGGNESNGGSWVTVIYRYAHINYKELNIWDFSIVGGCLSSESGKYIPVFDAIVKTCWRNDFPSEPN
jgi:hypothetical protein